MKRQLRTADGIKAEGIQTRSGISSSTATVAETANHYKLIVDGRIWDN